MLCLQDWYSFWSPLENSDSGKTGDIMERTVCAHQYNGLVTKAAAVYFLFTINNLNRNKQSKHTQRSSLFHVDHQVLHVLGNGFGIKQRRVHPSFTALEDHIHFLNPAYKSTRHKLLL